MPVAVLALGVLGIVAAPAAFAALTPPKSVTPSVSCFVDNGDGTRTVTIDVTNANATDVTLNYGTENRIEPAPHDHGQPTVFAPGVTNNAWSGTFTTAALATAKWHLNGNNVSLQTTTACGTTGVPSQGNAIAIVALGAVTTIIGAALMGERRSRHRLHREVE